jgi:uncharacterized membrane protein
MPFSKISKFEKIPWILCGTMLVLILVLYISLDSTGLMNPDCHPFCGNLVLGVSQMYHILLLNPTLWLFQMLPLHHF